MSFFISFFLVTIITKFLVVFKKIRKNHKKMTEKREFLRKTTFRQNLFFVYSCN